MVVSDKPTRAKKKKRSAEDNIKEWLDAVSQCSTLSRLNVLIGILESCVKWEKSAENAVSFLCLHCILIKSSPLDWLNGTAIRVE